MENISHFFEVSEKADVTVLTTFYQDVSDDYVVKNQFISNIKWYEFLLPLVLMALSWGPHRIMTTKISN